jgi:hypothetical protein
MLICNLYHQNRNDEERARFLASLSLLIATEVRSTGKAKSTLDPIIGLRLLLTTRGKLPASNANTPAQTVASTAAYL